MKEIIGYKCPMNLFDNYIIKGTTYKPLASTDNAYYVAIDEKGCVMHTSKYNLPKEIVETWEPIYKERGKIFNFKYTKVVVKDTLIFIDDEIFEISLIENFLSNLLTPKFFITREVKFDSNNLITIGCKKFTQEEAEESYKYLKTL
jgi:hypothetical protein